ncbi:MAG: response regulator [Planctomycetes bacterium]|nr:response regulator [Planctomycetota bacterium]
MRPRDAVARQPAHVLVVEPGARDSELFAHLSATLGTDVHILAAPSGRDAVALAATCTELGVAVILAEASDRACLELIAELRALHPEVGIVLVSATLTGECVRTAVHAEVDELVAAPAEPAEIGEVVRELLVCRDLHWSPIR